LSKVSGLQKPATLARNFRKSPAQTAEVPVFVETFAETDSITTER
jgi:hypothetical protein